LNNDLKELVFSYVGGIEDVKKRAAEMK